MATNSLEGFKASEDAESEALTALETGNADQFGLADAETYLGTDSAPGILGLAGSNILGLGKMGLAAADLPKNLMQTMFDLGSGQAGMSEFEGGLEALSFDNPAARRGYLATGGGTLGTILGLASVPFTGPVGPVAGGGLGASAGLAIDRLLSPETMPAEEKQFTGPANFARDALSSGIVDATTLGASKLPKIASTNLANANILPEIAAQSKIAQGGTGAFATEVGNAATGQSAGRIGQYEDLSKSAQAFADMKFTQAIDPKSETKLLDLVGDVGNPNKPGIIQKTITNLIDDKEKIIAEVQSANPELKISGDDVFNTPTFQQFKNAETQGLLTGAKAESNLVDEFATYQGGSIAPEELEIYKFLRNNDQTTPAIQSLIKETEGSPQFKSKGSVRAGTEALDPSVATRPTDRTLPEVVDEIRVLDNRLRILKAFDPSAAGAIDPSKVAKIESVTAALSARRDSLNEALLSKLSSVSSDAATKVAEINKSASASITWADVLQERLMQLNRAGVEAPANSLIAGVKEAGKSVSPTTQAIRKAMGPVGDYLKRSEKLKQADRLYKETFRDIDAYSRALTGDNLVTRRTWERAQKLAEKIFFPGGAGLGAPATVYDRSLKTLPTPEKLQSVLSPEEAQAISDQISQAMDTGDQIVVSKVMGRTLQTFPEVRGMFADPMTIAQSEYGGIIADPQEKELLKRKAFMSLRSRADNSEDVALFISKLNSDQPFDRVPKSLRFQSPEDAVEAQDLSLFGFGLA